MNNNELKLVAKITIPELAKHLSTDNIAFLFQTLSEKDDTLRYNAFLLLQANSTHFPLVYEYWDKLSQKLESSNSYQRSIGLMLIAENLKWDKQAKFNSIIDKYLDCCTDEKFVTARQAIQGLAKIIGATSRYDDIIRRRLMDLPIEKYKINQQKLLKKDKATILDLLEKRPPPNK